MTLKLTLGACGVLAALLGVVPAWAAPPASFDLVLRGQAFVPQTLTVPAGQTLTLMVDNQDALPAEFESGDLGREKVIPGGTRLPVVVGPLQPGRYSFFNDFHPASTGVLIAVPPKP
ncbi:hypothetical protein GALL_207390 [mine drainage metagenome]|uniref:EfeO-type cupredoxin-like domain-containing protein n=1 Tax=mine drainage metagenome TaxID=410659 RepID=A0A1J5S5W9_9ZZZZ